MIPCEFTDHARAKKPLFLSSYFQETLLHYRRLHHSRFCHGNVLVSSRHSFGGGAGIAVLLNHVFELPMSLGLWLANFIFLAFTVPYLDGVSAFGTIFVITVTSVSVNFFEVFLEPPFGNVWIDLLFGSVILGTGVAILIKQRVSNGGIGYVALAIYKYKRINPGTSLFWMNGIIFAFTAYVIDWKIIILAVVCQWISTRIINWIHQFPPPKSIYEPAWRKK